MTATRKLRAGLAVVALFFVVVLAAGPQAGSAGKWDCSPSIEQRQAIAQISADSLRGHLSFLASDLLEGRKTPSMGQQIAAEYIAAQFRRSGLKPVGDDGYFQTARSALRNVIGLLPGSDPRLSGTYVLLTAHYDGTGPRPGIAGGFNAANDNGSGTVSVIATALLILAESGEEPCWNSLLPQTSRYRAAWERSHEGAKK